MNEFIASLEIDHVSHHIDVAGDPAIRFSAKGRVYTLLTTVSHRPLTVRHFNRREKCLLCEESGPVCKVLSRHKQALFDELITYNSVRLHWLFYQLEKKES